MTESMKTGSLAESSLDEVAFGTLDHSLEVELMESLRAREFGRLDANGQVYLDHTGSALYPESLVRNHSEWLCRSVLGNPHSRNPSSRAASEVVDRARRRILEFFNADPAEYEAIFTQNASGALKVVGEAYPFRPESAFRLTADNHNSVNGIREFANAHGAEVSYLRLGTDLLIDDLEEQLAGVDPTVPNLFAYPAQSNFSGVKHPLEWIEVAKGMGYDVLLDAAAFAPTSRLDLGEYSPDFVTISFYKMFGFPTGVGVLLARKSALARLHRPWFGGGTVRFVSAQNQVRILYTNAAAFEDGTLNFLSLAAIPEGLAFLEGVGMERINSHLTRLTTLLFDELKNLRHGNGNPFVQIYGPAGMERRGGAIAFNLLDAEGGIIDCLRIEEAAAAAGVSLRTGYFCNPGAAESSFELPEDEAQRCYDELAGDTFTLRQFSACLHDRPVGAVRVSLGVSSNEADIRRLLEVLTPFRDQAAPAEPSVTDEARVVAG